MIGIFPTLRVSPLHAPLDGIQSLCHQGAPPTLYLFLFQVVFIIVKLDLH